MYIDICTVIHICAYLCMCVFMLIGRIHIGVHVDSPIYLHKRTHLDTCVHAYMYIYTCMRIYVYSVYQYIGVCTGI